jgi:UPF0755 protein
MDNMKYSTSNNHKKSIIKYSLLGVLAVIIVGATLSTIIVQQKYKTNLRAFSTTSKVQIFNIEEGATTKSIAKELQQSNIIRSAWAFEWYIRTHKDIGNIQSGQYLLNQSSTVAEIAKIITSGKVATDLVTILPARNLEQIKQGFVKAGFTAEEVNKALNSQQYSAHPALAGLPAGATLEGYLYPETFQKTAKTQLTDIVRLSLDEMAKRLTDDVKAGFKKHGLSVHEAITLASIVENESATSGDRAKVASVFLNRLKEGRQLQSNATDEYSKNNPAYDTYKIPGLPPGPISNVSESSISAVAFPADTDYLFFVTADDLKTTYFSKTVEEHNALVRKYCKENCAPH